MAAADVIAPTVPATHAEEESSTPAFRFPPKEELKAVLLDLSKPIAQRMRTIFYLRTIGGYGAVCAGWTG